MTTLRVAASLAIVIAVAGCAASKPQAPPTLVERAPLPPATNAPIAARPAEPAALTSVRVAITGTLLKRGDAVEICPGMAVDACPGVRVAGTVEDAWLSTPQHVSVWRLTGMYDGTTLALEGPAEPTTLADEPDYRNTCPALQKPRAGVNPDIKLSNHVEAFAAEHRERVAGQWWDRERQTMVIWVTGDPADLQRAISARAPGARVCIHGQARFSEAELERQRAKADAILREHGVTPSSSAGYVTLNQALYDVDAIDARTLARIASETKGAVRVVAFIELLANDLKDLPQPPPRGDVPLITRQHRSGGGLSALGRFTVHYDPEQRCVYFATPDERLLPVWFFGYWATVNPLRIYDYDDNLVAQEGDAIELGGGQGEVVQARANNACGAKLAWFASSAPTRVAR